ncbi:MAG: DUF349 domain-containing protein [Bacteroidales bacterium]|nr:DUF349 domain-containing protein [Bacteroidales bacterium]
MDTENNVEQTNLQPAQAANPPQETLDAVIAQYSSLTREELTQELKNLLNANDFEQMRLRIPLIRNAFSALPKPQPEEPTVSEEETQNAEAQNAEPVEQVQRDTVEEEFFKLYALYKEKRQQYLQAEEEKKQENLSKKKSLLEELKQLLESEKSLKEIYDDFNAIQEKWKNVGNVPHSEVNNLWESYHFLIEKFYEKVKINRELRDLDMKKNLEEKLILCEKAEELLLSEDINNSFQMLQEYHKAWKEIGPVPSDKNDEVWERFKKASDDINARRKEYYEKRSSEYEENYKLKQALVEQAEEINSHQRTKLSDWNKDGELMSQLVEKWKTVGPVLRQYSEDIWNKFKAQKDGFFEARKEAFAQNKKIEEDNYSKKVSICERAEQIVKRTDFDQATKELKALQEDWKKIGYVRKSLSDQIWLRFRAACDEFFKLKSEAYMQTHQEVEQNISKKEALIEELKQYQFTEDKVQNVEALKDFQKRWFEVGFTPKQERTKLQKQWDDIISENKTKLQISAAEIAQGHSRFLQNLDLTAGSAKKSLKQRIAALEKQIDSVENNLEFLASSKNAEILKKEFENKINRLKEEKNELFKCLKDLNEPKQKATLQQEQPTQTEAVEQDKNIKSEENN